MRASYSQRRSTHWSSHPPSCYYSTANISTVYRKKVSKSSSVTTHWYRTNSCYQKHERLLSLRCFLYPFDWIWSNLYIDTVHLKSCNRLLSKSFQSFPQPRQFAYIGHIIPPVCPWDIMYTTVGQRADAQRSRTVSLFYKWSLAIVAFLLAALPDPELRGSHQPRPCGDHSPRTGGQLWWALSGRAEALEGPARDECTALPMSRPWGDLSHSALAPFIEGTTKQVFQRFSVELMYYYSSFTEKFTVW